MSNVIGRRVGGGWEISSIVEAQRIERLKIAERKERQARLQRYAELQHQVEDGDANSDAEEAVERSPKTMKHVAKQLLRLDASARSRIDDDQPLSLQPEILENPKASFFFSEDSTPDLEQQNTHRSFHELPTEGRHGSPSLISSSKAPIDSRTHLLIVCREASDRFDGMKALHRLITKTASQRVFGALFSFCYCAFFRPESLVDCHDIVSKDLPNHVAAFTLKAADAGSGRAADHFPWILAESVCRLFLKIADPRLHGWFTENTWDRVYLLVAKVLTGDSITVRFARHLRERYFPPDSLRSFAQRERIANALPRRDRKEPEKVRCHDAKTFGRLLSRAIGGEKGSRLRFETDASKRDDAPSGQVDDLVFPQLNADPELSIFNTAILEDVDNCRTLIRRRQRESHESSRSVFRDTDAGSTALVESLKSEGDRDTSKLRVEEFLRRSAPSGKRKIPFETE